VSLTSRIATCLPTTAQCSWQRLFSSNSSSSNLRPPQAAAVEVGGESHFDDDSQRVLTVAIVGYPNAGKSELCNRLIGTKIFGVSSKANTTLESRLGAFTAGSRQVVLYDTPGLVDKPDLNSPVDRLENAWHTAAIADMILYIVDADKQVRIAAVCFSSSIRSNSSKRPSRDGNSSRS
jgi:ribosome biogenesis GTPase A